MYMFEQILKETFGDAEVKLKKDPELPTQEIKRGKYKYTIPYLFCLNLTALDAISMIINHICNDSEKIHCYLKRNQDDAAQIIADIIAEVILGCKGKISKGGRNGFTLGTHLLATGVRFTKDSKGIEIVFDIEDKVKEAIKKYFSENSDNEININELFIYELKYIYDNSSWIRDFEEEHNG